MKRLGIMGASKLICAQPSRAPAKKGNTIALIVMEESTTEKRLYLKGFQIQTWLPFSLLANCTIYNSPSLYCAQLFLACSVIFFLSTLLWSWCSCCVSLPGVDTRPVCSGNLAENACKDFFWQLVFSPYEPLPKFVRRKVSSPNIIITLYASWGLTYPGM